MSVFTAKDQSGNVLKLDCEKTGNCYTVSISKDKLSGVETLDFMPELFNAKAGDSGYYVSAQWRAG